MTITSPPQTREQRRVEQLLLRLSQSDDAERPTANATRYSIESFEIITACLAQMEATVLGLKELRSYVGTQVGSHMIAILIEEDEAKITEIKRRITQ